MCGWGWLGDGGRGDVTVGGWGWLGDGGNWGWGDVPGCGCGWGWFDDEGLDDSPAFYEDWWLGDGVVLPVDLVSCGCWLC